MSDEDVRKVKDAVRAACAGQQTCGRDQHRPRQDGGAADDGWRRGSARSRNGLPGSASLCWFPSCLCGRGRAPAWPKPRISATCRSRAWSP
ncbi:MAG: hypothetical protein MZV70_33190 [Desulfobacterales bacterium]|nr:hypothetical protein [Desulfobacterales bacterium]